MKNEDVDLYKKLWKACWTGSLEEVKKYVEAGADWFGPQNLSCVRAALKGKGDIEVLEYLFDKLDSINSKNNIEYLKIACDEKNLEQAILIIDKCKIPISENLSIIRSLLEFRCDNKLIEYFFKKLDINDLIGREEFFKIIFDVGTVEHINFLIENFEISIKKNADILFETISKEIENFNSEIDARGFYEEEYKRIKNSEDYYDVSVLQDLKEIMTNPAPYLSGKLKRKIEILKYLVDEQKIGDGKLISLKNKIENNVLKAEEINKKYQIESEFYDYLSQIHPNIYDLPGTFKKVCTTVEEFYEEFPLKDENSLDQEYLDFRSFFQEGDELWIEESPPWTWRERCGLSTYYIFRGEKVIASMLGDMN